MRNVFRTKYDFKNAATKEKITAALILLLGTNDLNRITVAQICEKSGIHRSTFYRHYRDVYSVLEELEKNVFEEYRSVLLPFAELSRDDKDESKLKRLIMRYLHICRYNRKAIMTLGHLGQYSRFYSDCVDLLYTMMLEMLSDLDWGSRSSHEFTARYLASSTFFLIMNWLEQDEIDYETFYKMYVEIYYADIEMADRMVRATKKDSGASAVFS